MHIIIYNLIDRFGEETVEKMVEWCQEHAPSSSRILEVGSGNGTLLFGLQEAGYSPETLTGIDYSLDAINLSRAIGLKRGSDAEDITFTLCDFLTDDLPGDGWDLVLDKGTYDAMALGEKDDDGHAPNAKYPERVVKLLKPRGRFLITCEVQYLRRPRQSLTRLQHVILQRMS